jgi:hypothetical protein
MIRTDRPSKSGVKLDVPFIMGFMVLSHAEIG